MALLLGSILPVPSCSAERSDSGPVATINLGTVPSTANTLIYIAQERGFFAANGLGVNILNYDTGAATTGDLLQGPTTRFW